MTTHPFITLGDTIGIVATVPKITYEKSAPAIGMMVNEGTETLFETDRPMR
jgi:hypothetical protein